MTFKHLRDLSEDKLLDIENWYINLEKGEGFRTLCRIYNENPPEYWAAIPNYFEEHQKMRYRQQIFVSEARRTMPMELKKNDKCNTNS